VKAAPAGGLVRLRFLADCHLDIGDADGAHKLIFAAGSEEDVSPDLATIYVGMRRAEVIA
jgi:hypothetical protein